MKRLLIISLLALPLSVFGSKPKQVTWGVYVTKIYDANLCDNSFKIDFWWWSNQKDTTINFDGAIDIPEAIRMSCNHYAYETVDTMIWESNLVTAEILTNWDVLNYPFDNPKLKLNLESAVDDTLDLKIFADHKNSNIAKSIRISNLTIDTFYIQQKLKEYNSGFGDPNDKLVTTYSSVDLIIECHREAWGIYIKLCMGVFVAFFIAFLAFFIQHEYFDARFGTAVGGLFAAVANKYVCEGVFPSNSTFTLIDKIHTIVFILIFLVMLIITASLYFRVKEKEEIARKIDNRFSIIIGFIFISSVSYFTLKSYYKF